jgi:hypothetical protein
MHFLFHQRIIGEWNEFVREKTAQETLNICVPLNRKQAVCLVRIYCIP